MNETKTNQEFLLEVIKASVDFNSNVLSVLTVEIAGDQSGKNRTHQKKVLQDLRVLGYHYSANLDAMYTAQETRLNGSESDAKLNEGQLSHLEKTKAFLDARMGKNPNRELADVANYLHELIRKESKTDEVTEEVEA